MKFKTKIAYTAVLATLGMVAGSAQAAYLSDVGTGQVLLYPYYTVQGGYDTYVSIVNTTSRAKAVKVRFIEAKASAEVLDFNLYLSKYDVWTAAITATTDGAKMITTDTSCTSPQITGPVNFRNSAYIDNGGALTHWDDILEDGIGRTREGYVEVIEMGNVPITTSGNLVNTTIPLVPISFEQSVTHTGSGSARKPADCAWVSAQWSPVAPSGSAPASLQVETPSGGLFGSGTLINVIAGTDYSYDPVAIDDFASPTAGSTLHSRPGDLLPSLNSGNVTSVVIRRNPATNVREVVQSTWGTSRDAVAAVLMRSNVMNEFSVEPTIASGTDWVVTFPTKTLSVPRYTYLNQDVSATNVNVSKPFTKSARTANNGTTWLACEPVSLATIYDREERTPTTTVDFSPQPVTGNALCFEANVITFNSSSVLASSLVQLNVPTDFTSGWLNMQFSGQYLPNASTSINGAATTTADYNGLPVIGFAVEKYVNGNVGGLLSNYGGAFIHKYAKDIVSPSLR